MRFTQTQLTKLIKETEYNKLRSNMSKLREAKKTLSLKVGEIPIQQSHNIGHYYKQIGHKTRSS